MAAITILDTVAANVTTPGSGLTSIFVDSDILKLKTSTGAVVQVGSAGNITLSGDVTGTGATSITTTLSNTGVSAGSYGNSSAIPSITVDSKGRITTISTTSVTIPPAFSGNLAGNSLIDTTNNRVYVQANPVSAAQSPTGSLSVLVTSHPSYDSGGNLNASYGYQSITSAFQSNVALNSAGGTSKTSVSVGVMGQFSATGTMNSNDRIRGQLNMAEIYTNGYDWGNDGTTSLLRPTAAGVGCGINLLGSGTVGHVIGGAGSVIQTQASATQTINYATGFLSSITQTNLGNGHANNIGDARLFAGFILPATGAVTRAIGLHTTSGWVATSGGGSVGSKYVVLNEDSTTAIQTNGPVNISNVLTVGNYASGSLPSGTIGSVIAISSNGGKLAYWDTTNSRWSYVFDNSAV